MTYTTLPDGYRQIGEVDLTRDRRAMLLVNISALIIAAVLFLLGLIVHPFRLFSDSFSSLLIRLILFYAGALLYLVLHELVHGVLMRYYSGLRPHYGFNGIYAYAGSEAYFDRNRYRIIALAPVVLLGTILLLLCIVLPDTLFWYFYLIQIMNLSGAAGDLYVSLLLKKLPDDLLVQDSGVAMKFYSCTP